MKKVVVVLGAEETKASEEMRAVAELVVTLARVSRISKIISPE